MRSTDVGVIVVEPLHVLRAGLRLLIDAHPGCSVLADVADPAAALAEIGRTRRRRVVVLVRLDVDGRDDTGALIRAIRERFPTIGVLATGADADAATISRALFAGADGFVDQRSRPDELGAAIASAADHLMVLTGPSGDTIGQIADALVQRREIEGRLTRREREVLTVAAEGLRAREIAARLGVSERTVTTHLASIYQKLGVGGRLAAVREALRAGLVTLDAE